MSSKKDRTIPGMIRRIEYTKQHDKPRPTSAALHRLIVLAGGRRCSRRQFMPAIREIVASIAQELVRLSFMSLQASGTGPLTHADNNTTRSTLKRRDVEYALMMLGIQTFGCGKRRPAAPTASPAVEQ